MMTPVTGGLLAFPAKVCEGLRMRGRHIHGHQLRAIRERAGLRTAELAKRADCSEGHLRNIEGGKDQPGGILTWRLAKALKVDIESFTEPVAQVLGETSPGGDRTVA
jgi:transcriptional regulator with XRE-family HTH domain